MKEITGDMFLIPATYYCITTNGIVKPNGENVMGKGVALQAKLFAQQHRYGNIALKLGQLIKKYGNHVHWIDCTPFVSFPTKHDWRENSDIDLIRQSARELMELCHENLTSEHDVVLLPRPGCSNGGLDWETQVRPVLEPILTDPRICIISK